MKHTPIVNFINILCTNFLYEHCFSTYFLALFKNLYEKRAHKTLMKLIPIVNFINILRLNFLYESASHSFSLATFCLKNFLAPKF